MLSVLFSPGNSYTRSLTWAVIGCSANSSRTVQEQTGSWHTLTMTSITADDYLHSYVQWSSILVAETTTPTETLAEEQHQMLLHLVRCANGACLLCRSLESGVCVVVLVSLRKMPQRRYFWEPCFQVLPHLWLGSHRNADTVEQLQELGVTHVLNVTCHHPPRAETQAALSVVYWPLEVCVCE